MDAKVSLPPTLYHDYFAIRGGGERLVLILAEHLGAHLVFGYRTPETYEPAAFPQSMRDLGLPAILRRAGVRPLALAALFATQRRATEPGAPIRIYSGAVAPFAAPPRARGARNIFYCHTPPRFLFDQRALLVDGLAAPTRLMAGPALALFERGYRRAVARMDVIVTNSETTRARIAHYLGRDSVVVYPPVDTGRFRWRGQGGYYLSTARLSGLKRVDRVVSAFKAMPDKRLVIASGGEERAALEHLAGGAANISFRGWVSDEDLLDLVGNAIATLYLPKDEDFGMSPVESMAAGKPVIGVAEGGLRETIIDGQTGVLLAPDFTTTDLVAAVRAMTPARAAAMRGACEARARAFSREWFLAGMDAILAAARREIAIERGGA